MKTPAAYRNYSRRARRAAWALDRVAAPFAPAARALGPPGPAPEVPRSILVVRLDHLGDVLMSTPALAALRAAWPKARLDVLASPWGRAALAGNPHVDEVLEGAAPWYDPKRRALSGLPGVLSLGRRLRRRAYDWAFDLRGDPRVILFHLVPASRRRFGFSGLGLESLLTDAIPYERRRGMLDGSLDLAAAAGAQAVGRRPVFVISEEDRRQAQALLEPVLRGPTPRYAVIAPGSNRVETRWGTERFARVASALAEDLPVVLVGGPGDAEVTAAVGRLALPARLADLAGRTRLGTLAAVLERASVLVTNDSGPAHLAAAVDCATIAIFGPSDPALTFPYEDGTRFVSVAAAIDHPRPCFVPGCPRDHGLTRVEPETVLGHARRALTARRTPVSP